VQLRPQQQRDELYVVEAILSHEFKSSPRQPRYTNVLVKWEGYEKPTWHGATAFRHLSAFDVYCERHPDFARVFGPRVL
jgi:hypothetical protein